MSKKTGKIPSVIYKNTDVQKIKDAKTVKTMPQVIKTQPTTTSSDNSEVKK